MELEAEEADAEEADAEGADAVEPRRRARRRYGGPERDSVTDPVETEKKRSP